MRCRSERIASMAMAATLVVASAAPAAAAPSRADLEVRSVGVTGSGAVLRVTGAVRNAGRASAPATAVHVLLSRDGRADARDLVLARVPAKRLARTRTARFSVRVRIPAPAQAGTWRLIACADGRAKVRERSERNNCRAARRALGYPAPAQPRPQAPRAPLPASPPAAPAAGGSTSGGPTSGGRPDPKPDPQGDPKPEPKPEPDTGGRDGIPRATDPSVPTPFDAGYLYTGDKAPQRGVAEGTIAERREAIVHGRVTGRDGDPLAGAEVTVDDHPELGRTTTAEDGTYRLAVNGGGLLRLRYEREGRLPAQRDVEVGWNEWAAIDDVALVALDTKVTEVDANSAEPIQVAQGNETSDADGERTATLLFPAGTQANMQMPDGTTKPLEELHVRATEFTVGSGGDEAMPGELPPASGYTYAAELSVDEALAAGAEHVTFSKPVFNYVENFLGFPVGSRVPTGYYDRDRGAWVPEQDGRVIAIVGEQDGLALVDVTGDGNADPVDGNWGFVAGERKTLAELYEPGQSLWRVAMRHFTPWDHNWPFGPPPDAEPPDLPQPEVSSKPSKSECFGDGSIIGCQSQRLGEQLPVAGTPYELTYWSDRVPGRTAARSVEIPLTGANPPASLKGVTLNVEVAGRHFERSFAPGANRSHTFEWDGRDVHGRRVFGSQPIRVSIGYTYDFQYFPIRNGTWDDFYRSFGRFPNGADFEGRRQTQSFTSWQHMTLDAAEAPLAWDARGAGLGGWTLDVHHVADLRSNTVMLGDGRTTVGDPIVEKVAGNRDRPVRNGDPTETSRVMDAIDLEVAPDGTIWSLEHESANSFNRWHLRRYRPGGTSDTFAVGEFAEDYKGGASDFVLAPDGSVYVAEPFRLLRIHPDGRREHLAGTGRYPGYGVDNTYDGRLATESSMQFGQFALAPDGTLYVVDAGGEARDLVRRISTDGYIQTIAGLAGRSAPLGDGGPALTARLPAVTGLAIDADGRLLVSTPDRVRRIGHDGVIETIAGGGTPTEGNGDGGPPTAATIEGGGDIVLGPDGAIYVRDGRRVRRFVAGGTMSTYAGAGAGRNVGGYANATRLDFGPMDFAPDGSLVATMPHPGEFTSFHELLVRVVRPLLSRDGKRLVPMPDGGTVNEFDDEGRHLRTIDALTGATLLRFAYDGGGRLERIVERGGRATRIERDAAGNPTAIVAPGGQRTALELDGEGWLRAVAAPGGRRVALEHTGSGLLTKLTGPGGDEHRFTHDEKGRLTRDEGPGGRVTTLERRQLANGWEIVKRTGLGRTSVYRTTEAADGSRSEVTDPSGAKTTVTARTDGTSSMRLPDGTTIDTTRGADPRWGIAAPVITRIVRRTPNGRVLTSTATRLAALADPRDPFSLTKQMDSITRGTRNTTIEWDAETRKVTTTTPEGRVSAGEYDEEGRLAGVDLPDGFESLEYTYDTAGRTTRVGQGARSWSFAYGGDGELVERRDALDRATRFEHDGAGAVTALRTPGGGRLGFERDARGGVSGVTMPGGQRHGMERDHLRRLTAFDPPGDGGALRRTFDSDGALSSVTLPGGRVIDHDRDDAGRLEAIATAEARTTFAYVDGVDQLRSATRTPEGGGEAQELHFGWDGELPTSLEHRGAAAGRFDFGWDSQLRLNRIDVAAGGTSFSTPIGRDRDDLVTSYGPFALDRGGPGGALASVSGNGLMLSVGVDGFGDASRRALTAGGNAVFGWEAERDGAGRIVKRTEDGVEVAFAYDDDGRLVRVSRGGEVVERYAYDANGNRTSRQVGSAAAETASYDDADRLLVRGGVAYEFDAAGFLVRRGDDAFTYSARGELLTAVVDGTTVRYAYDALGRRTARIVGDAKTQYLYGNPGDPFQVSAVRSADGVLTHLHYTEDGLLFALQTMGGWRYVATDQVGTPRAVSDASGTVLKRMTYDAFGVELSDSAPGVDVPLGYAGGLADEVTGLVRFGLRDYEPASGRWTARDPSLFDGGQSNLFAYVGNDPVNGRDPSGLICIGGSVYSGVGGGASVCFTDEGMSVCAELGLGFGTDGDVDFKGELAGNGTSVVAEAKASFGPFSGKLGAELDSSGCLKVGPEFEIGPAKFSPDDVNVKPDLGVEFDGKSTLLESGRASVQAKIAAKWCKNTMG